MSGNSVLKQEHEMSIINFAEGSEELQLNLSHSRLEKSRGLEIEFTQAAKFRLLLSQLLRLFVSHFWVSNESYSLITLPVDC